MNQSPFHIQFSKLERRIMAKLCLFVMAIELTSFMYATKIVFQQNKYSRDHAQYCCEKYGMSLLKIESQNDNDYLESFVRTIPGLTEIWLGLFHNSSLAPSHRFFWADRLTPGWTNFNNETIDLIGQFENKTSNESLCMKAVLGSGSSGFQWMNASCDEKIAYGCQVGVNISSIPLTVSDAECPKLQKLTGRNVVRSVQHAGGLQNYGYFDLHDKIYEMGTQIASHIVKYISDCALHCVGNAQCTEAIVVSELLCILYK